MRRKFTLLIAAVMLLTTVAIPLKVWADTAEFSYTEFMEQGTSGGGNLSGVTHDHLTIAGENAYGASTHIKVYGGGTLVITPNDGATISEIKLTATNGYIKTWSASDNSSVTINGNTATWSGSSTSAITLTNTETGQARITTITVTYSVPVSYEITALSNNTSYGTVSLSGSKITASPVEGCRYASPAYTVSPENSATVSQNGDEFTVTPSANTTVTINFEPIPTYTVTLGDDDSTLTEIIGGAGVTLPIRSDIGGYSFEGWSETNVSTETTTAPTTLFSAGTYHPTSNITLYPIYSRTESGSGTTDETVSVNISEYATEHGWGSSSSVGQKSITINSDVTATCNDGSNSGKYYNDGWRIYQTEQGAVTIATTNGGLKSVTFTFTVANSGTFNYNSSAITSGTAVSVSGESAVFTVGHSNQGTNGQVRITAISVTYTITGTTTTYYLSSPTPYPYSVIYDSNGVEEFVDQETSVFSLAAPSNVPTGFNFAGWTMVGTEGINVESLLSGENIDLSDYETDNATLVAVFSREEGAVPGDFELVTESLSDWSGNYLIAYDDETFADGRIGGTDGIGKQNSSVNPGTNLSNDVVNASWGNTYYVTLEKVGGNTEGYLLKTQDGKYNYQTSNSNGLSATNNRETAANYPLSVTLGDF